jgi:hypothetical protein
MRTIAVLGSLAAAGLVTGAVGGCVTAKGATYSQTLFDVGALGPNDGRIVFLRPDQRYDDASLSRMVVRIDVQIIGKLAYGGFLIEDVPVGEVVLEVSADNRSWGTCKLPFRVSAGDTTYFDASPRLANSVAGAIGTAVASVPGDMAASAAESAGKTCGGPYRLTPLAPAVALAHLDRLRASE